MHPVGHIGLEWKPETDRKLGLPTAGVVWATTLYISFPLRGSGLGGGAMRLVEGIAAREPVGARVVVLDTQRGSSELTEEVVRMMYTDRGLPVPEVSFTNPPTHLLTVLVLIDLGIRCSWGVCFEDRC